MKIMVNCQINYLCLDVTEDAGAVLKTLSSAVIYRQDGWGQNAKWEPCGTAEKPDRPTIEFVDDSAFKDATPLIDSLIKQLKDSEARWTEHYGRANALDKELKELKAKVATLNGGNGQEGDLA